MRQRNIGGQRQCRQELGVDLEHLTNGRRGGIEPVLTKIEQGLEVLRNRQIGRDFRELGKLRFGRGELLLIGEQRDQFDTWRDASRISLDGFFERRASAADIALGDLQVGLEQQPLRKSRCFGEHRIDCGAGACQVTTAGLQLDQRDLWRVVVSLPLHRVLECGRGAIVVAVAGISPARPVGHRRLALGLRDRILRCNFKRLLAFAHRDQGIHQAGQGAFGGDLELQRPAKFFFGRARIAV